MLDDESIQINHKICLELLDKFIEVCEKNQVNYYLAFGSCIGVVRHKGFIPWDINIDVLISIEDYRRLDAIMRNENLGDMIWCCPETRIYPLLMKNDSWKYNTKPNIDISVYTNAPDNKLIRRIITIAAYLNIRMYKLKNAKVNRTFPYNILKTIASIIPNSWYIRIPKKLEDLNCGKQSTYKMIILPTVWDNKDDIKSEWIGTKEVYGEFEGRKVRVFANTHEYLTLRYGDYMTPKVEVKGTYKHAKV